MYDLYTNNNYYVYSVYTVVIIIITLLKIIKVERKLIAINDKNTIIIRIIIMWILCIQWV